MIKTVTYVGELLLPAPDSYAAGLFYMHNEQAPKLAAVRIEYARDGVAECVRYFVEGKPWSVLYRDREAIAEIVTGVNKVVFRPLDERGGYSAFGFILPPQTTDFFLRDRSPDHIYDGDGCGATTAGCSERIIPLNFNGANQIVRLSSSDGTIKGSIQGGKPLVEWSFVPSPSLWPQEVRYTEWRLGPKVASARYTLVETKDSPGTLRRRDFIPKNAIMEVSKNSDVYGGAYDPNIRDLWAHYAKQQQIHARIRQQHRPPFGAIALAMFAVIGVSAFVLVRRRRTSPG